MEDDLGSDFSFVLLPTHVAVFFLPQSLCKSSSGGTILEVVVCLLFRENHALNPFQERTGVLNLSRRGWFLLSLPKKSRKKTC